MECLQCISQTTVKLTCVRKLILVETSKLIFYPAIIQIKFVIVSNLYSADMAVIACVAQRKENSKFTIYKLGTWNLIFY